jgi:hypothetical protein
LNPLGQKQKPKEDVNPPTFFIEVVLLLTLIFSWDARYFIIWDLTEVHHGNQRNINIVRKINGKCFIFIFKEIS